MQGPEDDAGLAGKVALVSGGGAAGDGIGNGRAAAILLARAGAKVLVADRDLKLAERTAEMIAAEGGTASSHGGDVTSESDCKKLVEAALDRWGRLDFLDNNVGIGSRGSVDMLKRNTNLHKLLVNSPEMARAFNGIGGYIRFKSKLDPRLRELAILQVG